MEILKRNEEVDINCSFIYLLLTFTSGGDVGDLSSSSFEARAGNE
jgi:hypothetical protein